MKLTCVCYVFFSCYSTDIILQIYRVFKNSLEKLTDAWNITWFFLGIQYQSLFWIYTSIFLENIQMD